MVEDKQDPRTILKQLAGDMPGKKEVVRRLMELSVDALKNILVREVRQEWPVAAADPKKEASKMIASYAMTYIV